MKIKAITVNSGYTAWMTNDTEFEPLLQFARDFMDRSIATLSMGSIHEFGVINGIVLHRAGQFQVELFIVQSGTELPSHGHPDIDSLEVHLGGDIDFLLEGRSVLRGAMRNKMRGHIIRVLPNQDHGARIGSTGGSFLSIQRWLNGVPPTSVGLNWSGPPHETLSKLRYVKETS